MIDKEKLGQRRKRYYRKNKKKINVKCREYYQKNKEKLKPKLRQYYQENKEKWRLTDEERERKKEYMKKYQEKNKDELLKKNKERYWKNRDKLLLQMRGYKKKNRIQMNEYKRKPEVKEKWNNHRRKREKEDKQYNITHRLRSNIINAFNKYTKTGKIMASKKYRIDYKKIIEHLKPLPKDIKNYEIHHIKPLFTFNFVNSDGSTNLEEIKKAFAPENHKLLTVEEHKKLNHYLLR